MTKEVKLYIGVEDELKEISVAIPDNAPEPWDGKDKLRLIGKKVPRVDGVAKATGKAKYTADMRLSGMLYAAYLTSPHPAAKVTAINLEKAKKAPGVKAAIAVQEKLPFSVRYAGQEVAAVAAETPHQAERALQLIEVTYKSKPFVVDVERAMAPDAPQVWESKISGESTAGDVPSEGESISQQGNVRGPKVTARNTTKEEINRLVARGPISYSARYDTQVQTHSALEPHGVVARWDDDKHLTVWASTQSTFSVQKDLAASLDLPEGNVRVITEYMGGGFGAKFGADLYGVIAAKLARITQTPVWLMLNRKQEHISGGNRPSSTQELTVATDKQGKIQAIKLISYGTAGVGTGAGTGNPCKNLYPCDKLYIEESDVFINAGRGRAFRAPGHPQGIFALEQSLDAIAYQLGMDPLEIRRRNTDSPIRLKEYQIGAEKFGWDKRNPKVAADQGAIKRGVGMANSLWYYFYGTGFQVSIRVHSDGSIEVLNGVQDIGTGIRTVVATVAAEELGMKTEELTVKIGDTTLGSGPPSGGSQTTGGITPAVRDAAFLAKQKMLEIAASLLKVDSSAQLGFDKGQIFVKDNPSRSLTWKQVASKIPGGHFTVVGERKKDYRGKQFELICGVQFVEVEVDTETGQIQVKRVVAVHDCGRPMNRLTLESQINGGIIQGVSYALFEDRILDRNTGVMVNPNLEQYKIAGALDIPEIESVVIDVNHGVNSTSAMGIGEPATVPTSAAIANAFYHATGSRIYQLPMTPERVLAALSK